MSDRPFFADRPGAVLGDDGIAHFGDPVREQRRLERGEAIAPRDDRAVIEVSGPDRLSWLDSITSQFVANLQPGDSTELLVLDPHGRVEHVAAVFEDGASVWLIADAGDAAGLAKWLTMMRFRSQVTVAVRDDLAVLGFFEHGSAERLVAQVAHRPHATERVPEGMPLVWEDPWRSVTAGGWQYAATASHPGADYAWVEAIVERTALPQLAGAELAGLLAVEALRVAAWRPRWAREIDDRAIPHEYDWLRTAVHLNKGCYRGQETVAKVHNLGHPPRRLTLLHLDGSDSVLPEPGAIVVDATGEGEPSEVGHVTTIVRHHELGPVALAVLARRVPADATLEIRFGESRVAAAQEVIVPADAGATAEVPRLTRLSRRPVRQEPAAPDPAV